MALMSVSSHFRNEPNYAATLSSIIVIFVVCHLPRVVKTIFEIVVTNRVMASGEQCNGINPAKCLTNFNNFILTLNASSGFLVYCFVGTFGTQFVEVLTSCCRPQTVEGAGDENKNTDQGKGWRPKFCTNL